MDKRRFLSVVGGSLAVAALAAACTTTGLEPSDPASRRRSIDARVDDGLAKLYAKVPGSRELVARARGVLVFPSVVSAGLVVGGSYGQGALRKVGRSAGYYGTSAGSVGLLAGAQSKAVYILFMTEDSLARFQAGNGWTAGVDASITVIDAGAEARIDTATLQQPIVGFALSGAGLMADLSFDGSKFDKLDL